MSEADNILHELEIELGKIDLNPKPRVTATSEKGVVLSRDWKTAENRRTNMPTEQATASAPRPPVMREAPSFDPTIRKPAAANISTGVGLHSEAIAQDAGAPAARTESRLMAIEKSAGYVSRNVEQSPVIPVGDYAGMTKKEAIEQEMVAFKDTASEQLRVMREQTFAELAKFQEQNAQINAEKKVTLNSISAQFNEADIEYDRQLQVVQQAMDALKESKKNNLIRRDKELAEKADEFNQQLADLGIILRATQAKLASLAGDPNPTTIEHTEDKAENVTESETAQAGQTVAGRTKTIR